MIAHKWNPIQPIDTASEQYDFSEIDSLQRQWLNIRDQYDESSRQAFDAFRERLERSWAIETGIIEGLYTLGRGVTETLISEGITADFIERGDTNRDPQDLVTVLKDQQEAIVSVYQYIREGHPLTRSFIRQLHQVLTRHQDTYSAVDQFGTRFEARLDKGEFKSFANNPTRQDGSIHEYCPPEHVESEIDNMLYFYNEMQQERGSFHPLLTGAWLHHAFTQVHPFQDGNGRVVRALLAWHLVKENFLPIVVTRDDREGYIKALESADQGSLHSFVDLIAQLEKRTILAALGEPEEAAPQSPTLVSQVVDHIVDRIRLRNQARETQLRSVNRVASIVRDEAVNSLSTVAEAITARLNEAGMAIKPYIDRNVLGEREHWYAQEIIKTANNAKHWVTPNEARLFLKLTLDRDRDRTANDSEIRLPRLVFVISLHHVGRQLTGIVVATAFARIETFPDEDLGLTPAHGDFPFQDCTVNPFTLTWEDDAQAIAPRFLEWAEGRLGIALSYWQEFLN